MAGSQIDPEVAQNLLGSLAGPLAKRLSSSELRLEAGEPLVEQRTALNERVPSIGSNGVRSYVVTLTPEGEEDFPVCGYLVIGLEEGPPSTLWGFFWGFIGPTEEPFLAGFRRLGKSKRLREEIWEIEAEVPARGMFRWFGIPKSGTKHFVEIKSFGTLGAQLSGWAKEFTPAAVVLDLPNDMLSPASQRSLPQLIGADLWHLLPFLRISLGLEPTTDDQEEVPYPIQIADQRRRPPVLFLSYSRKDDPSGEGSIGQLYKALQRRQPGITFLDSSDLKAGDEWRSLIDQKLSETAVLTLLVSSNSLQSDEVKLEFETFISKLMKEEWPGTVIPIPIDAEAFEFFRAGNSEDGSWWGKSAPLIGGEPSLVGLASFNFERESLSDLGPEGIAERLLAIYSRHRDAVQARLSEQVN